MAAMQGHADALTEASQAKDGLQAQLRECASDLQDKVRTLERMEIALSSQAEAVADLHKELDQARRALEEAKARSGGLFTELESCRAAMGAERAASALLRSNLEEQMRWIESLETSSRLQRRKISELWGQLQAQQRLEGVAAGGVGAGGAGAERVGARGEAAEREAIVVAAELGMVKARLAGLEPEVCAGQQGAPAGGAGGGAAGGVSVIVSELRALLRAAEERASKAEHQLADGKRDGQAGPNLDAEAGVEQDGEASLKQDMEDVDSAEDAGPSALPDGAPPPRRSGGGRTGRTAKSSHSQLRAELAEKEGRIGEMETEIHLLREMVKARETDARIKEGEISRLKKELPARAKPP